MKMLSKEHGVASLHAQAVVRQGCTPQPHLIAFTCQLQFTKTAKSCFVAEALAPLYEAVSTPWEAAGQDSGSDL